MQVMCRCCSRFETFGAKDGLCATCRRLGCFLWELVKTDA